MDPRMRHWTRLSHFCWFSGFWQENVKIYISEQTAFRRIGLTHRGVGLRTSKNDSARASKTFRNVYRTVQYSTYTDVIQHINMRFYSSRRHDRYSRIRNKEPYLQQKERTLSRGSIENDVVTFTENSSKLPKTTIIRLPSPVYQSGKTGTIFAATYAHVLYVT